MKAGGSRHASSPSPRSIRLGVMTPVLDTEFLPHCLDELEEEVWLTYYPFSPKMDSMKYIPRIAEGRIRKALDRNKSILLLGPRQTGKTTLLERIGRELFVSFVRPDIRLRYEKAPSLLAGEVAAISRKKDRRRPLVLLDEVQRVPEILDVVQDLIDRRTARFVLTGSSARKLRRGSHVNLLPGRLLSERLDPLSLKELPATPLEDLLLYGSLPGIYRVADKREKEIDLQSYVLIYLEEEVRAEALVRNLGPFARFLECAASESGRIVHLRGLSQELGVSHTTVASYYQILEDCLIAERIEPITKSNIRKRLTRSPKFLFFDLGVRRVAAREGVFLPKETMGHLLEQFVGLELVRMARQVDYRMFIRFWRDPNGPEVDWVIEREDEVIPVEVKWTDSPSLKEARHLKVFLEEYNNVPHGWIICRTPRKVRLEERIIAYPWQDLPALF